jgi:integrase
LLALAALLTSPPLNIISRQLGHSSSAVTSRYIDHVAPQDVIGMGRARRAAAS